jgi:serine/threonine protein phosphatase PrpC
MISPEDTCLILATDGLWEFVTSQDAVSAVNLHSPALTCEAVCEHLEEVALQAWRDKAVMVDDITVLLVYLRSGEL